MTVPCTISCLDESSISSSAQILNLSQGGIMLVAEQCFIPNHRVEVVLQDGADSLLFEYSEVLHGTVRWSQQSTDHGITTYHVGVALEQTLPRRIHLTEH